MIMETLRRGMMLTAGPSITNIEIDQVMDAVRFGWNASHSAYIRKFQEAFAEYLGMRYAMCTSSCTGALHLSLAALGIQPGDEVLVPDVTWVASGFAPTYVGAKPVFVDIEPDTWCMSPESLIKNITPKTRAIIPVHLYGHPCDMDAIMQIARAHNLRVIEDAAPAAGASWGGKKAGSFGDTSAFSFQGAKIMVAGEGGMFCTNDEDLYKQAQYLNDYAVDSNKSFWVERVGYKFRMSNLQASLGLAQLQRLDELVLRKRTIFGWYQERLKDISEIELNTERPKAYNNYWMPSLVLANGMKMSTDEFRAALKDQMVDTRPFFFPMSSLPMFTRKEKENPVAYDLWQRGVNLPGGHNLTEDDIDYACNVIRKVLGYTASRSPKLGAISKILFEKNKSKTDALVLPFKTSDERNASLRMMTYDDLEDPAAIEALAKWREAAADAFPAAFKITLSGTQDWLQKAVLDTKDRLLFWVVDSQGKCVGHVGLFRFDFEQSRCEIDNIVRGEMTNNRGLMASAIQALLQWQQDVLGVPASYLRVFSDNERAMRLYERLGYEEIQRIPMKKIASADRVEWKENFSEPYAACSRYFVTMRKQQTKANA
jgi:perosamine synthetase